MGISRGSAENLNKIKRKVKDQKKVDNNDDEQGNVTDEFNIAYDDDIINLATYKKSWVIYNSATIHITYRIEIFSSYTHGNFGVKE